MIQKRDGPDCNIFVKDPPKEKYIFNNSDIPFSFKYAILDSKRAMGGGNLLRIRKYSMSFLITRYGRKFGDDHYMRRYNRPYGEMQP